MSLILHVRSKYPVSEMFRQDDLSQFFLGNSGPLKRQNEQRTIKIYLFILFIY
jgi:hypothetical protein